MADPRAPVVEWSAAEVAGQLRRPQRLFVLDVRNRDEFEAWKVEGREPVPTLNVPYFEILEQGGKDEVVDSVREFFGRGLGGALPRDRTVLAVCAKGGTSDLVALGLRELGYDAVNLAGGMAAWAEHYGALAVVESADLAVYQVSRPARGCLSYLVASAGRALVIDPLRHVERYLELARERGLRIEAVLDTHAHADHISGGPALARAAGAPYLLHPYDGIHPFDVVPGRVAFEYLRDDQELRVGRATARVLHIPGHTLGNSAVVLEGRYLFSGDSIFIASVSRPDLGGRAEAWTPLHHDSLRRLLALPEETLVLPGHYASPAEGDARGCFAASLGRLKRENADLRLVASGRAAFVAHILHSLARVPPEYVEIKRVNAGLVEPDEDKAFELETGKNICGLAHPAA